MLSNCSRRGPVLVTRPARLGHYASTRPRVGTVGEHGSIHMAVMSVQTCSRSYSDVSDPKDPPRSLAVVRVACEVHRKDTRLLSRLQADTAEEVGGPGHVLISIRVTSARTVVLVMMQ
jgi:hypothetical protein